MDGIQFNFNNTPITPKKEEKKAEEVKHLSAKLHPEYDKDLREMLQKVPRRERSKLYRDAVRYYLTHKGIG